MTAALLVACGVATIVVALLGPTWRLGVVNGVAALLIAVKGVLAARWWSRYEAAKRTHLPPSVPDDGTAC